ncbi:MAG TPA: alpha-ketoglutarate-dependent dioxygenase AlkB [Rhodanobacteraceae bacterium]|nr:alpha-ketoglutarate-dependent dioxygenase AlkB [Rhodanobacteraceae bacterium]
MTQFGLFDAPLVLVGGERRCITYYDRFVPADDAEAAFAALRGGIDWQANRRVMYEREVDVPRLTAHFPLAELASGEAEGIDAKSAAAIAGLARRVSEALAAPFNSIGLNFYRDGNDSVAPHNDRLDDLVKGEPIALVSLGSTRRMTIRSKTPGEPAVPIDLEAGSLLAMSWSSQLHYTHGVAKTKAHVGERISIALRVRLPKSD